jgi:hypothetical protein
MWMLAEVKATSVFPESLRKHYIRPTQQQLGRIEKAGFLKFALCLRTRFAGRNNYNYEISIAFRSDFIIDIFQLR